MREALDVASRFSFWMYECNLEHGFMLKGQIIHDIMSESESEACLHGYGDIIEEYIMKMKWKSRNQNMLHIKNC